MVQELMVHACHQTGLFCQKWNIPAVYRTQMQPDEPIPAGLLNKDNVAGHHEIFRLLKKAELSTIPGQHCGLGVSSYTQVTSPIRRYQDLIMHFQIRGFLRQGFPPLSVQEIFDAFSAVETQNTLYNKIERDSKRYWTLKYLEKHVGNEVAAIVIRESGAKNRYIVGNRGLSDAGRLGFKADPRDQPESHRNHLGM